MTVHVVLYYNDNFDDSELDVELDAVFSTREKAEKYTNGSRYYSITEIEVDQKEANGS